MILVRFGREDSMTRFVVGDDRSQSTLFPERLDDYLSEDNPVRAIDIFVDELDLGKLGFGGVEPEATGRPAYHPGTLLKISVYGYLNRVQSSRRLERECQRNIELVWLTGRLMPDFKTIADFRKDNGEAIRRVCREFVVLCRRLELFSEASVAIDGSKFKAVNPYFGCEKYGHIERDGRVLGSTLSGFRDLLEKLILFSVKSLNLSFNLFIAYVSKRWLPTFRRVEKQVDQENGI